MYPDDQDQLFRIAPRDVVRFVGGYGPGDGMPSSPYWDIDEALWFAPDHATLIVKAGITDNISGGIIDRPLTLKGYDVTIAGGGT